MKKQSWGIEDSIELYAIEHWGKDFFSVSENGEVLVRCLGEQHQQQLSLYQIARDLEERGLGLPILVRFGDLLKKQLAELYNAFNQAISTYAYQNMHQGVYPVKTNQQEQVLAAIKDYGKAYNHGLEVGSKAELVAALAYLHDAGSQTIIVNGYKDAEFINLGLYARQLGIECIFVIESLYEVPLIIDRVKQLGIEPILGIRTKLTTAGTGYWQATAGEQSVFGLNPSQIIDAVDLLKKAKMLHCLQLLHYHLGSQIPNIQNIRVAVAEACRFYLGLVQEGAAMNTLDLGGGLAVDYDGSNSTSTMSMNYTLEEYCAAVIETITETIDEKITKHPRIITESGRATVAYSSVLLFNILDTSNPVVEKNLHKPESTEYEFLEYMYESIQDMTLDNIQRAYHDIQHYRDEIRSLFHLGVVSLRERALTEELFWQGLAKIKTLTKQLPYPLPDFEGLDKKLASTYYGNLSIFQSLPDVWAIDQVFPVVPIHRLNEKPDQPAIISDITCDCDGKINQFVNNRTIKSTIPLHKFDKTAHYYLGVFLVGAYQETLGDLHNLFGDTHVVSVAIQEDGTADYSRDVQGDTVAEILSYVEYQPKTMLRAFIKLTDNCLNKGTLNTSQRRAIINAYENALRSYTYHTEDRK